MGRQSSEVVGLDGEDAGDGLVAEEESRVRAPIGKGVHLRVPVEEAAVELARALGVRVYTVGVGTRGPAPFRVETPFGTEYVQRPAELDEDLLEGIAEATAGQYFRATDPEALREVFRTIDALETTVIESRGRVLYTEYFHLALFPALLLLLLERLGTNTRLATIP